MKHRTGWVMSLATVLVATASGWSFWFGLPMAGATPSPAIGKPGPRIDLVRLCDRRTFDEIAASEHRDVVLLHCWGTWCGPCRNEYPELAQLAEQLECDGGFRFVPVSVEWVGGETFEGLWSKTKDFFDSHRICGVAYADPRGVTRRSIAERLERDAIYYPTSVLIDANGTIVGVWEGYDSATLPEIEVAVNHLIAG